MGDNFTMGPDDALRALEFIEPRQVLPIHYNTFPPIEQDAANFVARAEKLGVGGEVLEPGESLTVK